jgi:ribosomal protein S18 acetylase RimI-like enzyme
MRRRAPARFLRPRLVIGPARHADLARLVDMMAMADAAERAFVPELVIRRPDRRHTRRALKRTLNSPARCTLVARAGGRVVGTLGIDLHRARHRYVVVRRHAYMHSLFVDPALRRAGVARRLVARGLAWARRRGAQQVRLEMAARNRGARRLYEACGFRVREMMFTLDLRPGLAASTGRDPAAVPRRPRR